MRNTDQVAMQQLYAITPEPTAQSTATKVLLVEKILTLTEFGNVTLGDYELEDED